MALKVRKESGKAKSVDSQRLVAPKNGDAKSVEAEKRARASLKPGIQAAATLMEYNKDCGDLSLKTLISELEAQCQAANEGNLKRTEALLISQAHALDAIFHSLARRARRTNFLDQYEVHLRLALKAQSQCRATLETLAMIKNPQPVAFVRQANIAHGMQQVNNDGDQTRASSRAQESESQPNKLLESQGGNRMVKGTAGSTGQADSAVEAVGAVHRTEDDRG